MTFNPAAAIAISFIYSLLIAVKHEITALDALLPAFLFIFSLKHGLKPYIKLLKLNLFIVFLAVTVIIFHRDYNYALLIFLRANLILTANLLLFHSLGLTGIYYGFCALKLPHRFTVLLFFVIKYIEILRQEFSKMKDALKLRGFRPRTSIFTYKTTGYLVGMLFVKSMERARKMHQAMILRGFKNRLFPLNMPGVNKADFAAAAVLVAQTVLTCGQYL
jgi:cobalt/nickel transport system permease protein